jgi:hypothetical protein
LKPDANDTVKNGVYLKRLFSLVGGIKKDANKLHIYNINKDKTKSGNLILKETAHSKCLIVQFLIR